MILRPGALQSASLRGPSILHYATWSRRPRKGGGRTSSARSSLLSPPCGSTFRVDKVAHFGAPDADSRFPSGPMTFTFCAAALAKPEKDAR
jgi:hypothetical protein